MREDRRLLEEEELVAVAVSKSNPVQMGVPAGIVEDSPRTAEVETEGTEGSAVTEVEVVEGRDWGFIRFVVFVGVCASDVVGARWNLSSSDNMLQLLLGDNGGGMCVMVLSLSLSVLEEGVDCFHFTC